MAEVGLVKILAARKAIAEAKKVDELKNIRDKAEAVRMYAKQAGLGLEIINDASEIKLRAERRAGEMLTGMQKNTGAKGVGKKVQSTATTTLPPKLGDMGVTKDQSYRWRSMNEVPEGKFEDHITSKRAAGEELTTAGVMGLVKKERRIANTEKLPFEPQVFNIWNFQDRNPAFGTEYPGNIPGDIIQNLLWLYTKKGDTVIDPFAGGCVTLDVCKWWTQKMWHIKSVNYDAVPSRDSVVANDITQGYPKGVPAASLIFLDPPYWKQKKGDYKGGDNLADMPLDKFDSELTKIASASINQLKAGGHLALLIGATRDGERFDHAAHLMAQLDDLKLVERIIVPYSSQQAAAYHVSAAKKGKLLLNRYRDLLVWQK